MPLRGVVQWKSNTSETCASRTWESVANGWEHCSRSLLILQKCRWTMNSSTEQASGFSVKTEKCEASGKDCRSFILIFKETDDILHWTPVKWVFGTTTCVWQLLNEQGFRSYRKADSSQIVLEINGEGGAGSCDCEHGQLWCCQSTVSVHSRFSHWEISQVGAASQAALFRAKTSFLG